MKRASPVENPLDLLAGAHATLIGHCATLERLAGGGVVSEAERQAAVAFLRDVLPVHLQDEETDLFPLLRHRCADIDSIGLALGMLGAEHDEERDQAARVLDLLSREALTQGGMHAITTFAREQRRHAMFEDSVVLPVARLRLQRRDLADLHGRMMVRRAVVLTPQAILTPHGDRPEPAG